MTNKFSLVALFSAAILGGAFFAANNTVNADSTDTDTKTQSVDQAKAEYATKDGVTTKSYSQDGQAFVSFEKNDPTGPIDPTDPGKTPDDVDPTTDTGYITLDAIPNVLNFGNHDISTPGATAFELLPPSQKTQSVLAKEGTEHTTGSGDLIFTQVTNVDPANPTWTLSAKLGEFTDGKKSTLKDATIDFGTGKAHTLITDAAGARDWAELTTEDKVPAAFTLAAGGDSHDFYVSSDKGTTQQYWDAKDVHLNVPTTSQVVGNYAATVTWALNAAPATDPAAANGAVDSGATDTQP